MFPSRGELRVVGKVTTRATDRRLSLRRTSDHLGLELLDEGGQMAHGRIVEGSLGAEMREHIEGVEVAQPGVGVRSRHAVLGVVERALHRRWGRLQGTRHGRHRTATVLAALLAMVGLALVAPAATHSAAGDKKVTFTMAGLEKVDNFNPFKGYQAITYEAWALMYDYLVGYKMSDMSPTPELATSWDTSNDGLTWTFHMRSGLKWSDGKPLTAADVAYTFTRVLNGSAENLQWGTYLKTVKTAPAPDDPPVVLKLSKPMATLPLLPIPIIPEHIWKNVSEADMKTYDNEPSPGHPIVGSGPFELTSGTSGGSTYTFERNPYFWGPKPHVDEVVFRVYESPDPMVQALVKGEVDFVEGINGTEVKALQQGHPNIAAHNGVSPLFEHIGFNTGAVDLKTGKPMGDGNPAMKDPKFRHALGFALDRGRIASNAFQGQAIPGQTIIPDFYTRWHWDPPADQAFKFSISTAGQLPDPAGHKTGTAGFPTKPHGAPLRTPRPSARS